MSQTFSIPGRMIGLNEYAEIDRLGSYGANKAKQEAQRRVIFAAKQARLKPARSPVMLNYTWYEPDLRRDENNVIFAQEFVQGALVNMGIVSKNGRGRVVGTAHFVDTDRNKARIEVEIMEL